MGSESLRYVAYLCTFQFRRKGSKDYPLRLNQFRLRV